MSGQSLTRYSLAFVVLQVVWFGQPVSARFLSQRISSVPRCRTMSHRIRGEHSRLGRFRMA